MKRLLVILPIFSSITFGADFLSTLAGVNNTLDSIQFIPAHKDSIDLEARPLTHNIDKLFYKNSHRLKHFDLGVIKTKVDDYLEKTKPYGRTLEDIVEAIKKKEYHPEPLNESEELLANLMWDEMSELYPVAINLSEVELKQKENGHYNLVKKLLEPELEDELSFLFTNDKEFNAIIKPMVDFILDSERMKTSTAMRK